MSDQETSQRLKYLEKEAERRVECLKQINERTQKTFERTEKAFKRASEASGNVHRLQINLDSLRTKTNEGLEDAAKWCKEIINKTDSNTASISQLQHNIAHLSMQAEQTQKSISMLSNSLDITQSTVMSVNEKIAVNKPEAKKSAWSQIPLKAWITGGAVLIIFLIYLKTGQLITIKEITG